MLNVHYSSAFKQDYKRCQKRGCDLSLFLAVLDDLVNERELDEQYKDHPLIGDWKDHRELHITPDWLLIITLKMVLFFAREWVRTMICSANKEIPRQFGGLFISRIFTERSGKEKH